MIKIYEKQIIFKILLHKYILQYIFKEISSTILSYGIKQRMYRKESNLPCSFEVKEFDVL